MPLFKVGSEKEHDEVLARIYLGDDWTGAHLAVAIASEGIWSGGDSRVYHYTTGFHQHIYR